MMKIRMWLGYLAALSVLDVTLSNASRADLLLFSITDVAWGNTGWTSTAPLSFMVSLGACANPNPGNCNVFSTSSFLNPIAFGPSADSQSVTITGGAHFAEVASALETGNFEVQIPRILSSDGTWPGFPAI